MNGHDLDREVELLAESLGRIPVDRRTGNSLNMTMTEGHLHNVVDGAIAATLNTQRHLFEEQIREVKSRVETFACPTPEIESYKEIEIIAGRNCNEHLDIVKSLPDFEGRHETYVSCYDGSSEHYQPVAIIRNKVKGPADMVLSSFNTVLNFKAIIARLDFMYSDKRPIYLIEQELSTLRQGNLTLLQFYDEVEKKLTLLTNKTIMTYDGLIATPINAKYRMDALQVFVSGTKKELSNVLFSAQPSDLPSALALAQEVESNRERYLCATNYAKSREDKEKQRGESQPSAGISNKNPYFVKRQGFGSKVNSQGRDTDEPMDVDESARFRRSTRYQPNGFGHPQGQYKDSQTSMRQFHSQTGAQTVKSANSGTARLTGPNQQRVNTLFREVPQPGLEYRAVADSEAAEYDQINFLGMTPWYHS